MFSITRHRIARALARTGLRTRALVAVALAGAIASACDVHGISEPGTLQSITVTPNATIAATSSQQMIAVGHDADGRVVPNFSPTWSIAASGGTISSSGVFTAGGVTGLFSNTVVASVGPISGRASITVTAGPLASISIVPNPVTLAVTATQQFVAVGKDASGNIVQFAPTWSVVAGGGAITQAGIFTAGGTIGTYANTVQASHDGIRAFATVNVTVGPLASISVTPNPATLIVSAEQQFVAVGRDGSGNSVTIAAVWSVVAGGGTVDGSGRFTAGATPGTFTNTVKATSGTLSGTATVIVTAGPLAIINVTPNPATMPVDATQQFTAAGTDVAGNPVAIVATWDLVAGGGSIDGSGLFTSGSFSGTFTNTVRASSGGLSGRATVIVISGPLATIVVTPNPVFMPALATQQFVAVGRDANGNLFVMSPVWSVVNGGGTINATGLFTAGGTPGFYMNTVRATFGAINGSATVTVNAFAPPPPPPPVSPLGAAAPFGILAGTGITCAVSGTINGPATDLGSSPLAVYTGFAPPPAVCTYTGTIQAPPVVATAKLALTAAYLAAAAQVCNPLPPPLGNNLTGLDLGVYNAGNPLPAGTYCFNTSAGLTGNLTLTGPAAAVWTFQIGSTLIAEVGSSVTMAGGSVPNNVYWQVGSSATLRTNSQFQGNIMALASITLEGGVTLIGRALARNGAVDMTVGGATITKP